MLTVLQLLPALESGGVERGTVEVARAIVARGHRAVVISGGGRMVNALCEAGAEHIQWPIGVKSLRTLAWARRLRAVLENQHVDILHARSRVPAWVGYLAWRRVSPHMRPSFVTTVHGLYSVNPYSAVMVRGERVIAVSQTVHDYILKSYPWVRSESIQLIPRGVDDGQFPYGYRPSAAWLRQWHEELPTLRDRVIITLPGRITRLKGHFDFLALLSALVARGWPVHGLIVGAEDRRRRHYARVLRERIRAAGLRERVSFLGQRSDMREVYAVSRIVLSLSAKPESFGRTVLEALRLGVPVVGYDHGGVGEVLSTMFPEGRVRAGDVAGAVQTVERLLRNPRPVPDTGAYPLQRMLDDTLDLYEALASVSQ